jgi:GAF domain-containing protein
MLTIDSIMTPMTLEKLAGIIAQEFENIRNEMRTEFASVRRDLRAEVASLRSEMETGFSRVWDEFALIHQELAGIHHVIDGLNTRLTLVENKVDGVL